MQPEITIEQTCPTATFYGYNDARCYDEYRPERYGFDSDDDKYRWGYACGMDENLKESGGIASVEYRGMPSYPRIKALASEAADIEGSNADELHSPSVTPVPQSIKTKDSQ